MALQKGRSGNPGGRPRMPAELRDLCRRQSDLAVEALIDICRDQDAPANVRANAAKSTERKTLERHSGPVRRASVQDKGTMSAMPGTP